MTTVSVIIPAYGHADYILLTLDSVFAQTFKDYEIIVVNDGSPDDTAKVLRPLVDDGRIRYFEIPNGGVANARNFGISKATGEFIALLDDDDLWPPDKLEWQVSWLRGHDAIAVGGRVVIMHMDSMLEQQPPRAEMEQYGVERFFQGNPFISPGQVMFRRSAFERGARFDPEIWGVDDLDFWIELTNLGSIFYLDKESLTYRVHLTNASKDRIRMMRNAAQMLRKRVPQLPMPQQNVCAHTGYTWLLEYLGMEIIRDINLAFFTRNFQPKRGFNMLYCLFRSFSGAKSHAPSVYTRMTNGLTQTMYRRVRESIKIVFVRFTSYS